MARHLMLIALVCSVPALAGALDDPMRPPSVTQGSSANPETPAVPRLQSIVRRQGARPAALIDGQRVEVGTRLGDARVIAINETSVDMRGPGGRYRLSLTPEVQRSPRRPAAPGEKP
ncbi:MAG: hypothetical protein KF778_10850 [Rhodocyclaceae bacterium]|nr:hypothetical protein [Rhodocyclaceae bacterium]MBX3668891.1 hypothetical protein [Rhodocyclaceae bacterium]